MRLRAIPFLISLTISRSAYRLGTLALVAMSPTFEEELYDANEAPTT